RAPHARAGCPSPSKTPGAASDVTQPHPIRVDDAPAGAPQTGVDADDANRFAAHRAVIARPALRFDPARAARTPIFEVLDPVGDLRPQPRPSAARRSGSARPSAG